VSPESRDERARRLEAPGIGGGLPSVVAAAVTAVTLSVAFGLLALGVESFWVVFVVGFGGVLPLATVLARRVETRRDAPAERDEDIALQQLRARYARGELTDAEFERRVERLLETDAGPDRADPRETRREI
jgi:uncharacterized membrane protein